MDYGKLAQELAALERAAIHAKLDQIEARRFNFWDFPSEEVSALRKRLEALKCQ